ncbi:hypothetical protein J4E86_000166 [Alternaria arbusti]|uniref:uncharacterized protein n=1 Tax=Alternaria arbusti TaxID=232088 RepID=UPI00221EA726|nr:uncharacterized protein J4E86_000166 [Alternaria arbusti]KAI4961140.1 hypothetical protein J4E86_000166 [Alternaria arbusti]
MARLLAALNTSSHATKGANTSGRSINFLYQGFNTAHCLRIIVLQTWYQPHGQPIAQKIKRSFQPSFLFCEMTQQNPAAPNSESNEASVDAQDATTEKNPPKFQKGPRFWAIMVVLSLVSLLTALEATVTSTVMPSLVADLGGGEEFIWVSNAYFLTM